MPPEIEPWWFATLAAALFGAAGWIGNRWWEARTAARTLAATERREGQMELARAQAAIVARNQEQESAVLVERTVGFERVLKFYEGRDEERKAHIDRLQSLVDRAQNTQEETAGLLATLADQLAEVLALLAKGQKNGAP